MKQLFLLAGIISLLAIFMGDSASALGLKVAPQQYRAELSQGERKKAFVDIGNPTEETVTVNVSVQAFRQINDDGGLQFYDDKAITAGITPEVENFELGPKEAVRLTFFVDGKVLPEGDVFAALFFTTEPAKQRVGAGQLVRVGTLLSLVNVEPGERKAEITTVDVPFFQLGNEAKGTYAIRNTGAKDSGFYPEVTISSWPVEKQAKQQASLIFGGRERSNSFSLDTGIGLHRIDVRYGDSSKSSWALVVQPWLIVLAGVILLIVVTEVLLLHRRRRNSRSS